MTPNEARAMLDENRRLREFVELVMSGVWNGDTDDGAIQDEAERLGIIEKRPVEPDSDDDIWGSGELYFLVWK